MRQILRCDTIPATDMPASPGVKSNDWVFISGMNGLSGEQQTAAFDRQVKTAMDRIAAVAEQAGIGMDGLLKCNVYLKDMNMLPCFDEIYGSYFTNGIYPARYVFEMPWLCGPAEVVVEAIGRRVTEQKDQLCPVMLPALPKTQNASHAIRSGNFIFTSAIPPADYENGKPDIGFDDQIRRAIENMIETVTLAGGSKASLVKVIVFLKDLDLFDHFNTIYREYFDKNNNPPARSCFGVSSFDGGYEVALECVAYTGDDRETLWSPEVPAYDLPFCQGIRAEDMVFVSGQVGCSKKLGGMPESFSGQMDAVFHNMFSVAKAAGAGPDDFVRTTGYLVHEEDYEEFKRLYKRFWGAELPASVIFKVSGISYDYAMEIDSHVCISR